MTQKMRTEKDSAGELPVPAEAYYGIQSVRASQNFPISGLRAEAELVEAVMFIKKPEKTGRSFSGQSRRI